MADQGSDVSSTLNELERKLRALEHELQSMVPDVAEPPAPPADDPEEIIARARQRIAELRSELDDLTVTPEQTPYGAPAPYSAAAPYAAAPVSQPPVPVQAIQQGAVVIDAGYFADIASLSAFEQSVAHVPGVVGARVRSFEQGRAIIDAQLSHPISLGTELARYSPLRFAVTGAGPQHLVLAISG